MRTREGPAEQATVDVKFCLMFPREALSVPVMRHVLGDTLRKLGIDDDSVGDLLLAVTEACTNVLQHGGEGQHRYEVVASVSPDDCLLEVLDSGTGFRPGRLARHRMASHLPALPPRNYRLRRRPLAPPVTGPEPAAAGASGPAAADAGLPASAEALLGADALLAAEETRPGTARHGGATRGSQGLAGARGRFARARRYAADRAIADLAESGRGLAIMRACVDNVSLRSGPGRETVVSLHKHISGRQPTPPAATPPARLRDAG
jgi:anti-sigma regulatory factor (Ser/Thr protein kinase)